MHIELKASFIRSLIIKTETDRDNEIPFAIPTVVCTNTRPFCSHFHKATRHTNATHMAKASLIIAWYHRKFSVMITTIHAFNLSRYSWFYLTSIDPFRVSCTPYKKKKSRENEAKPSNNYIWFVSAFCSMLKQIVCIFVDSIDTECRKECLIKWADSGLNTSKSSIETIQMTKRVTWLCIQNACIFVENHMRFRRNFVFYHLLGIWLRSNLKQQQQQKNATQMRHS